MNVNRLADYLDHMRQAARDACEFIEDLAKDVEPLLFDPRDKKKVLLFREFVKQSF